MSFTLSVLPGEVQHSFTISVPSLEQMADWFSKKIFCKHCPLFHFKSAVIATLVNGSDLHSPTPRYTWSFAYTDIWLTTHHLFVYILVQ